MGRRPSASRNPEKAHMPENTANPFSEREKPLPGNTKPSVEGVKSQLKNPNSSWDGVGLHHEGSPAQEQVNLKSNLLEKSTPSRMKKSRYNTVIVRRSDRIKSAVVHTPDQVIEPHIEDLTGSGEKNEPVTQIQIPQVLAEPDANSSDKSMEEKFNYVLQRLEALEKLVESLQSEGDENIGLNETPSSACINYRRMYIDSQKKIEALMDENRQLTGNLQNALGKIEVFEKESRVLIEVLEKVKDAVVISNLAKTTEVAVNASTQAIHNACAASANKRKRNAQESGRD